MASPGSSLISAWRRFAESTRPVHPETARALRERWAALPGARADAGAEPGPARRRLRGHARGLPEVQPDLHALLPLGGREQGARRRRAHAARGRVRRWPTCASGADRTRTPS